MRTVLLFIYLYFVLSVAAFSQKKVDVVYLKNDSVLVGNIIYKNPGVSVTLKTLNQEYLYIERTEIELIRKQKYTGSNGSFSPISPDSLYIHSRYWFWLQGGGRIGLGETKSERAQVDMINGFHSPNQLGLGLGIGARFMGEDLLLVPVYCYVQAALSKKQVAPMAAIGAGMVSNPSFDWKIGGPFF